MTCFQPIIDTFEHRIFAYECLFRQEGDSSQTSGEGMNVARFRSLVIHLAARQELEGLYFFNLVHASIDDPEIDMRSSVSGISDSGMKPANVVFEVVESDLARDPVHSHLVREYLRRNGFGFALSRVGIGAGSDSFRAVADFAPDYISLERSASAPAISKLVRMAEESGARVVAEGVDRARMVENLWLLGVRFMQGHLFGQAVPHIV
jgi:EAL domain-containing protein (putative c-di-GMP-specific phosphodiesterase class I)